MRLLQGGAMVAREAYKLQAPAARQRSEVIVKHAADLARSIPLVFGDGAALHEGRESAADPDWPPPRTGEPSRPQTSKAPPARDPTWPPPRRAHGTGPSSSRTPAKGEPQWPPPRRGTNAAAADSAEPGGPAGASASDPAATPRPGAPPAAADSSEAKAAASVPADGPHRPVAPPRRRAWTGNEPRREFKEAAVPSGSFGRAVGFGSLGARMAAGLASDWVSRAMGGSTSRPAGSAGGMLSGAAAETLADGLCRMRGAALKIGQIISLQDEEALGSDVAAIMERVRTQANVMPRWQLEQSLVAELGDDWLELLGGTWRQEGEDADAAREREVSRPSEGGMTDLSSGTGDSLPAHPGMVGFDSHPVAAASIGQVHRGVLGDGRRVAVKVQYPGVTDSIDSDLTNVTRLLKVGMGSALPAGLYLDSVVRVARAELRLECDYEHEARAQERFRRELQEAAEAETRRTGRPSLLAGLKVPAVVPELSSQRVLTTEWLDGVPIDRVFGTSTDEVRSGIARRMLRLTLWELFEARLMQTDPNWGNFFYDPETDSLGLLDFGAAKEFPPAFVDDYLRLVWAAAARDEDAIVEASCRMGFFTGHENASMVRAHVNSGLVIGEPFAQTEPYDFKAARITRRVSDHTATFARQRLTPPPDQVYSLHRKLAGAYLLCIRMGAKFPCRDLLERTVEAHTFTTKPLEGLSARESLDRKAAGDLPDTQEEARTQTEAHDRAAAELGMPPGAVFAERGVRSWAPEVVGEGQAFISEPGVQLGRTMRV